MSKYADGRYHLDISEMTAGTRVDGAYSLVNPQVAPKRDGSPYFKCLVRDATGQIPGRLWSIDPAAAALFGFGAAHEKLRRCEGRRITGGYENHYPSYLTRIHH